MEINTLLKIAIENWIVLLLFFSIAILYSSVGFGGGSSYLAVLALSSLAFPQIRATALLCNIVVVGGSVIIYAKNKEYNWRKVIPLITLSIPLSFLGGYLRINESFFFILLGLTLLAAAIAMWNSNQTITTALESTKKSYLKNGLYGGIIGLISGMVGIGGGVFLAPLLHLSHWDSSQKIAATASFFILVNSLSGFIGQSTNPNFTLDWNLALLLSAMVFLGGQIGVRLSYRFFSPIVLKKATAILIAFVSVKILSGV
ncbi:sulfite exporter TauE/SafE family protein [Tenacibaculum sp. SG-28]|uniref:sulfite exporter TauE/SafE family protein n=1 Tax=Tenacibaculum sp. SG-28 TaxID=754426 RepID=UPI000CF49D4A|nr:sulfite exporter TauE/SafE family protein [Tenacibaculum sp. SG-28]PQJ23170.1 hypothetical protein BSU00_02770 [Tenacibaculum sp. SG-28]